MSTVRPLAERAARIRTMRAAVIGAPGQAQLVETHVPDLAAGQVLLRVEGSGVCGSDLPEWEGRKWFSYPREPGAPGHEGWGVVAATGADVDDIAVGDRVAALSYHAYADYDVAAAEHVIRLPASLDHLPVPAEPLGCAMNVFRRSHISAGQTVAIVGIGFLGALLTQLADSARARVIAISRRPYALDVAGMCGADELIQLNDRQRVSEQVRQLTDNVGCDCVIEAGGAQGTLDLAGELTRERGRLVVAGFHQDGPRQVDMFLWNWRGLDVINAHERDPAIYLEGMRAAVVALERGVLRIDELLTHRFSLTELPQAMMMARTRPDGFLKALVLA